MPEALCIGVDIGGTKIAAGVVDDAGRILQSRQGPTPTSGPGEIIDAVTELVAELSSEHHIFGVGVGAAGYVDEQRAQVVFSPHLPWRQEPLRLALERRIGLPVHLDNDANACAWAESRFGAARDDPDFVAVTLGTGIGGCLFINSMPYRGAFGLAGEFGHMIIEPNGRPCECGNLGCWEQYASGRVLQRRASEALAADTPFGRRLLDETEGRPADVTGSTVGQRAQAGDPEAIDWLNDVGHWLGVGLANLAAALDPALFVIGGGVSSNGELLLEPARTVFAETLTGRGFRPQARIVGARHGAEATVIGAADQVRSTARRRR